MVTRTVIHMTEFKPIGALFVATVLSQLSMNQSLSYKKEHHNMSLHTLAKLNSVEHAASIAVEL